MGEEKQKNKNTWAQTVTLLNCLSLVVVSEEEEKETKKTFF